MRIRFGLKMFTGMIVVLLLAGCATQRVNWNSRVGAYTLDQAITDLGPPDKQAKLSNGQLVAEWISRYWYGGTAMIGPGFYGYPGGVRVVQSPPEYYESKLRLIFTTNNVLTAWSKH